MKIGIIGYGFVGQAVAYGFDTPKNEVYSVDPNVKGSLEFNQLAALKPDFVFICVPTPSNDDGSVDTDIVLSETIKALHNTRAIVVIKSTVTPDFFDTLVTCELTGVISKADRERVVYNPEFLTERAAKMDFVQANFHVFGGKHIATQATADLYYHNSNCISNDYRFVTRKEASLIKYTINTFLATKVSFFNQIFDIAQSEGCNYRTIVNIAGMDERVGVGQTVVPGPDGKRGFGGACLPKDTAALFRYSQDIVPNSILKNVLAINDVYRVQYELDEREKVNNIKFTGRD